MSTYSRQKTTIMPKIIQSLKLERKSPNEKKKLTGNENYYLRIKNEDISEDKDKEKKPGTSIDPKKPINIFPKIYTNKAPPATANSPSSMEGEYKINYINGVKNKKSMLDEDDKVEKFENIQNNNITNSINVNQINHPQPQIQISNDFLEEKKLIKNKKIVDINKYKDISINFLINNSELCEMFEKLYKNDKNTKKKWVEQNLFGREVFKIRLETYIKNKVDIPSFIKNEIQKLLSNQYCDYVFKESYNQIQSQYDEHLRDIENIYN